MAATEKDKNGTAVAVVGENGDVTDLAVANDAVIGLKAPELFGEDRLHDITDFAAALKALEDAGVVVESSADYGTGFAVVEDKSTLVGVPFIMLQWRFSQGTFGPMVTIFIVTESNQKYIVNDGSSGILQQMATFTRQRLAENGGDVTKAMGGVLVPKGLTRSDYEYTNDKGAKVPATTFYVTT